MKCREYLHHFMILTECPDFQPWHWCWPGQHQPLHSIMALLTDLEENPSDPLAAETRKLIDLALCICGESGDNGIVSMEDGHTTPRPLHDGGSRSWDFIRRERDRIWEKHGLDPSILTCPEKAEDISFVDREGQISDDGFPQGDMFGEQLWGPLPDTNEAWTSLGYATDPYLEFDMSQDLFRVT